MPIELPPEVADYSDDSPETTSGQLFSLIGWGVGILLTVILLLNWLTQQLVWWIPTEVEQQLAAIMRPVIVQTQNPPNSQAARIQDTLNQLLDRLEVHLPESARRDFIVTYSTDPTVNAVALPGDQLVIFQGLLAGVESENELMMVLGHELGHFAHRDHLRGIVRGLLFQVVLATLVGDPSALQAVAASSLVSLSSAQYSQGQEKAADAFGLDLLQAVYGHVAGATDFFTKLSQSEAVPRGGFLASHPSSPDRIRRIEQLTQQKGYTLSEKTPLPPTLAISDLDEPGEEGSP
ncbi:MAG: M48 family metallopeptidase [Cyanobacteriota bacterium]|nr:M48 family metallopeptidase [Cyanobacteriota bacterium]